MWLGWWRVGGQLRVGVGCESGATRQCFPRDAHFNQPNGWRGSNQRSQSTEKYCKGGSRGAPCLPLMTPRPQPGAPMPVQMAWSSAAVPAAAPPPTGRPAAAPRPAAGSGGNTSALETIRRQPMAAMHAHSLGLLQLGAGSGEQASAAALHCRNRLVPLLLLCIDHSSDRLSTSPPAPRLPRLHLHSPPRQNLTSTPTLPTPFTVSAVCS